jgi:hypothetical protein
MKRKIAEMLAPFDSAQGAYFTLFAVRPNPPPERGRSRRPHDVPDGREDHEEAPDSGST